MTAQSLVQKPSSSHQTKTQKRPTMQHPLFGIALHRWIRLVQHNRGVGRRYRGRALFITLVSMCTAPARVLCSFLYRRKITQTPLQHPPIFIIGHWRSGTTYLHELLSQDPQFGYLSLWQSLLPDSFLVLNPLKQFLARFLPAQRPMDGIKVAMDSPYEDEAALAVLYPWSFFHCLHFPQNAEEQYQKAIHFSGLAQEEKQQWKATYQTLLQTVTYASKGKRFLSKNPPNTARISTLLELFPQAYFIHIYRNPYKVYLSTQKMRRRVVEALGLQEANDEDLETQVVRNYVRLMQSYFEQKKNIDPKHLVEVQYEELTANPLEQIQRIYTAFHLPGLQEALPAMQRYLDQQAEYKTNVYSIDKQIIDQVKKNWEFTIDLWGYDPPS